MKTSNLLLLILSASFLSSGINAYAFTVTKNQALSPAQCTEERDGRKVYESNYIYLNADGTYTNENGTFPEIYPKDVFLNYGYEFVIRGTTSSINVSNTLPTKVTLPDEVSEWSMPTNYVPAIDNKYVVMGATAGNSIRVNRSVLTPTDAINPAFQIAYTLTRVRTNQNSSRTLGPVVWQYFRLGDANITKPWGDVSKSLKVDNSDVTRTECFNYYLRFCGDGLKTNSEVCDPADTSHSGWGTAGCDTSCKPINNPPENGVCSTTVTGPQDAPLTNGACNTGSVVEFRSTGTNPINYTWKCSGINGGANSPVCSASYTPVPPTSFNLSLKKYVEGNDAQDTVHAYGINKDTAFQYTIVVTNNGNDSTSDTTTVTDTLPTGVTLNSVSGGADWNCTSSGNEFICTSTASIAKDSAYPTITVNATTRNSIGYITNTATVTNTHDTNTADNTDPAVIAIVGNYDLSVKKYVKGDDIFSVVAPTEDYDYNIIVTNNGPETVTGTTTIRDILPSPIVLQDGKKPSGNGWDCSGSAGANIVCTTTAAITSRQLFPTITVPARVTNLAFRPSAYVNYAYVHNPFEAIRKRCRTDGTMPDPTLGGANGETPQSVCNEDYQNFDAATVRPPNPNGFDLMLHKYVNVDDEASRPNANGSIAYTFFVRNLGALASSGTTTVTDTDFPAGITISQVEATQGIWSCTYTSTSFTCTTNAILQPSTDTDTITVYAQASDSLAPGTYRNVACLSNPNDPDQNAAYNPDLDQYKINNCNPAEVVVVPPGTFDLTIVKKVGNSLTDGSLKDRNSTDEGNGEQNILIIGRSAPLVYTFDVRNLGPVTATGTTTVEDTLPEGITATSVTGAGWSCAITGNGSRSWRCTRTTDLALGASFPTITLEANASATVLQGIYSNIATVSNPGDTNPTNNTDPANVKIVVTPTCGSLTANPSTSPNTPNTPITYTCTAVGYTGNPANLEYNITCGTSDLGWSGSATRMCPLPNSYSTTQVTTCKIQDKTNSGVIFTGSMIGACRSEINTTGGGGGGGPTYVGKSCVNNVPTCGIYARLDDCMAHKDSDPRVQCYNMGPNGEGLVQCRTGLPSSCGGGGASSRCGDGVLTLPEQCDLGSMNGTAGSACSSNCKINTITNPGENPLTDIWMTIPTLSKARLGYSWLDNTPGKVAFHDNSMIVGSGTKLFTLADTISFGIKTQYTIPLIIEADKKLYLSSTGSAINTKEISTTFGRYADSADIITICGTNYVVMGVGDYQVPDCSLPPIYTTEVARSPNNIQLFKGSDLYQITSGGMITLNSVFQGVGVANLTGSIVLSNGSSTNPLTFIPLVALDVKVSGSLVGTAAGTVNRKIESYIQAGNLVNLFLSGIKSNTTTTANTTTASSNNATADVNVNTSTSGHQTGSIVTGGSYPLERFAVNGNKNILSVKNGDLTIDSCGTNKTLTLDGVRTVIVENGDLIIKCNIVYASNDTTSSWAFIVKGGDIRVYNGNGTPSDKGVTNLAGVYVAIDGDITYAGAATSQAILKVDGSLYGNAEPLFDSRLYVRGTSAYEILTTGVVLSYSNRALVSPPPLLSSYLNNYSVTRVVK